MILRDNEAKRVSLNSENSVQSTLKKCTKHIPPALGNIAVRVNGGGCLVKICSYNWNQTQSIQILAPKQVFNRHQHFKGHIELYSVPVDLRILPNVRVPGGDLREWSMQRLPSQNVEVIRGGKEGIQNNQDAFCELASPTNSIKTFDGLTYNVASAGT